MKYYYENSRGEEVGPVDEDLLIEKARNGELNASTLVRNHLVRTYRSAEKIACLKEIVAEKKEKDKTSLAQITKNLHRSQSSIKAPPLNFRLLAFTMDLLIISLLALIFYNVMKIFGTEIIGEARVMALFLASTVGIPLTYYSFFLGLKAQTPGFWFFGIMVVKGQGDAVFAGRAFFMCLLFILTLPIVPVFILLFDKGLHEALTGTRVVKVRLG